MSEPNDFVLAFAYYLIMFITVMIIAAGLGPRDPDGDNH